MNSILAFLFLCIPARIILALGSQFIPNEYLVYYGILLAIIGLSFLYLFITNSRLYSPEAGGKTWWSQYRILIGLLYITAAVYAFQGKRNLIWVPLAIDIIFGIIIFGIHHLNVIKK